jgi:hypothetical protein
VTEGPEYAPPRELSVDEIIARLERRFDQRLIGLLVDVADLRAIIAKWRERGEALKRALHYVAIYESEHESNAALDVLIEVRAALGSPAKSQT